MQIQYVIYRDILKYITLLNFFSKYFCVSNLQHWYMYVCLPGTIYIPPPFSPEIRKKPLKRESLVLLQLGPGPLLVPE